MPRLHSVRLAALSALIVLALLPSGPSRSEARSTPNLSSPREALDHFIGDLRLGAPRRRGAITIIPIRAADASSGVKTLSEALKDGSLAVHEIGEGRVNQLEVENTGKIPVFIMAGQILVGAKQNRVLQSDVLLPPNSGRVTVSAFCVQHGRWSYEGGKKTFSKSDNVSNPQVRQAASVNKEQSVVWAKVDETRRGVGASATPASGGSDSSDLNAVYDDKPVRKKIEDYENAFTDLPQAVPDMQGAIVLLDGRVVAADVFGDRAVFRRLWRPLLASYVVEGARRDKSGVDSFTDTALAFLQRAMKSDVRRLATPGGGVLIELVGTQVSGAALLTSSSVMHVELFPGTRTAAPGYDNEPPIQRHR